MNVDLRGKRLLVMDRTALAACAVKRAKELGLYTIVANFYKTEDSPSKQIADEAIEIDISNIDAMCDLIREKKIDGIFVGWTDSHLPFYAQICEKMGLPCCGTVEQFDILSNDKRRFKKLCLEYGVPVPQEYHLTMDFAKEDLAKIVYPVLVKPADESGSRGIKRCNNEQELIENYTWLYNYSKSKKIFVEKYIESPCEVFLHYTVQDSVPSLSCGFIKQKIKSEGATASSAILHTFIDENSRKYIDIYRKNTEESVLRLIEGIGIKNGPVMFQGFMKDEKFYFYESGLRMGGEQYYVFASPLNGVSTLDLMIEFSVTGKMTSVKAAEKDNAVYSKSCVNYYITLKAGEISAIKGLDEVVSMPQVLQNATFKKIGDKISATNSLDRVIYRIHVMDDTPEALAETLVKISNTLCILDTEGNEMQAERLTFERALEMTSNSNI